MNDCIATNNHPFLPVAGLRNAAQREAVSVAAERWWLVTVDKTPPLNLNTLENI